MKQIIALIAAISMCSNFAFADDCKFNDLVHNPDGTVTYSKDDHRCVGELVQDDATKTQQVITLKQALTLKDDALTKSDQRTQLWMDTTFKLEDNIQKIDQYKSTSNWIYFGLGALTVIGAGMMAAQLSRGR